MSFVKFISLCVCASFSFGFEEEMKDSIVLIPDRCLSFYLASVNVPVLFKNADRNKPLLYSINY